MPHPHTYHIALGSNLGNRLGHLQAGVNGIDALDDTRVLAVSGVWETEAHIRPGSPPQPDYFNAVLACTSSLNPGALLEHLLTIERQNGRQRDVDHPWEARTLDLDILAAGNQTTHAVHLQLPHPRLPQRRFVLEPFSEIAAELVLPAPFHASVGYLLAACPDRSEVRLTTHLLHLPRRA